jgi:copper chaperone NosL
MKQLSYFILLYFVAISCSVEPAEINYGKDACEFCKMNIVDEQHASEIVTQKGKAYKFDAIECMMNYLNRNNLASDDMAYLLIANYDQPGELIDAKQAYYVHSEAIPSPMGAFLSGFDRIDNANLIIEMKGGEVLDWNELKRSFKVN